MSMFTQLYTLYILNDFISLHNLKDFFPFGLPTGRGALSRWNDFIELSNLNISNSFPLVSISFYLTKKIKSIEIFKKIKSVQNFTHWV